VLDALSRALDADGIAVVATASDGLTALSEIYEHAPHVAVVDFRLPDSSGIEITTRVGADTGIVLYTSYRDRLSFRDALAAGARAVVLKEAPLDDVARAVHAVASGGMYIDPLLAEAAVATEVPTLSPRERSVLQLLANGERGDSIAETLTISPDTVRAHVRHAMRKLATDTRTQAVAEALRRSLID
jgi:DNA-binding NarL/FixJ family response regulator